MVLFFSLLGVAVLRMTPPYYSQPSGGLTRNVPTIQNIGVPLFLTLFDTTLTPTYEQQTYTASLSLPLLQ
jgi:hypothetical protein